MSFILWILDIESTSEVPVHPVLSACLSVCLFLSVCLSILYFVLPSSSGALRNVPDIPAARADLAAQHTTIRQMVQGADQGPLAKLGSQKQQCEPGLVLKVQVLGSGASGPLHVTA